MNDRIDAHESTIDTNSVNLSRLVSILNRHEYRIKNNTDQIADLSWTDVLSKKSNATLKELIENVEFQGNQLVALDENIKQIETITVELNDSYQNMSETLSCLMLNASNLENRIVEFESNFTAYLHLAMGLAKDVSNIEVNLTECRTDITYQEGVLIALNKSIKQMNSVLQQLNTSSLIDTTMLNDLVAEMEQQLNQLKSDIATNHEHIENNIGTISLLEGNISSLKTAYGILRVNLTSLETATVTTNDAVRDNYDGIATLFINIAALNGSTTDIISRLSTEYSGFKGTYFFYHAIMLLLTGNLSDNSKTFNYVF